MTVHVHTCHLPPPSLEQLPLPVPQNVALTRSPNISVPLHIQLQQLPLASSMVHRSMQDTPCPQSVAHCQQMKTSSVQVTSGKSQFTWALLKLLEPHLNSLSQVFFKRNLKLGWLLEPS